MRTTKETLKLEENLSITVTGIYTPSEKEIRYTVNGDGYPGSNAEFDIVDIDVETGNLLDYTNHIQDLLRRNPVIDIIDHFSELAILNLEKDV